jgi:hypothetical protein
MNPIIPYSIIIYNFLNLEKVKSPLPISSLKPITKRQYKHVPTTSYQVTADSYERY